MQLLTPKEIDATAAHEAGHFVAALGLGIPSFPEVFSEHRKQPGGPIAGTCHLGKEYTAWQGSVIAWAGVLGQAMLGQSYVWMPPFKPTKRELRDWHSMMTTRLKNLSDTDQQMIADCPKSWAACKHAFTLLSHNTTRLKRMTTHIANQARKEIAGRESASSPEKLSIADRACMLEAHLSRMKPDAPEHPKLTAILGYLKRGEEPPKELFGSHDGQENP